MWLEANRNVLLAQVSLQLPDARIGEVKDRRGKRGVGMAVREDVGEMIEAACAARGDDRDIDRVRDRRGHLAIESRTRAVAVHRRQEDLAGAARLGFPRPLN